MHRTLESVKKTTVAELTEPPATACPANGVCRNDSTARSSQEEVYRNSYDDPRDAHGMLDLFKERYNPARPHWALPAADPATAPARVLTPHEVYVQQQRVNPPSWSRWVGRLEKDQEQEALPPK